MDVEEGDLRLVGHLPLHLTLHLPLHLPLHHLPLLPLHLALGRGRVGVKGRGRV